MIDAELYRVFLTVARSGTVSAAAKALYVSQPAVSKSIRKLEDLTGCTLFQRSSRGVRLTSEGRMLIDYVSDGFESLENGERILKKIRNRDHGLVRVGISTTLCRYYFLPHLEKFHKAYPGIRIIIVNRTSAQTLELVERGHIDFGIVSLPEECSRFTIYELLAINDVFVAAPSLAGLEDTLPLQALGRYPLMFLEQDNVTRRYVDSFLARHNIVLRPEIEIGSMDFLIEFARIGLGVALVIRNFVTEDLRLGVLREIAVTPAVPPRKVGIVVPRNLPLSIAAETFISALCDTEG